MLGKLTPEEIEEIEELYGIRVREDGVVENKGDAAWVATVILLVALGMGIGALLFAISMRVAI